MTDKCVEIIDCGFGKLIRINEPGAQHSIHYVDCTFEEGKAIREQLGKVLDDAIRQ